jgi:hypothetical protein
MFLRLFLVDSLTSMVSYPKPAMFWQVMEEAEYFILPIGFNDSGILGEKSSKISNYSRTPGVTSGGCLEG